MLEVELGRDEKRSAPAGTESEEREDRRARHLRELWAEVVELPRAPGDESKRDGVLLERYRLGRIRRNDERVEDDELRDRAREIVELAFADSGGAPSLSPDSRLLTTLFASDRRAALAHLHKMLDADRVPSAAFMRRQALGDEEKDEENMYARARERLDAACRDGPTSAASSQLDALLEERLRRVDHLALVRRYPARAFLEMLAEEPSRPRPDDPTREEYLLVALRLWEALAPHSYSPETYRVLENLIRTLVNHPPPPQPNFPTPALVKAVALASKHLPAPRLVFLSSRLLAALTVTYPSLPLARSFYSTLRSRAPFDAPVPFVWHSSLRESWTYLLRTSLHSSAPDPALGLRLYFDWSASGLLPPRFSWPLMWRTLGTLASVEDTERTVQDFERAGKIVPASVATTVLRHACASGRLLTTRRLLDFFRERFPGARGVPVKEHVPLEAFNLVLEHLAESKHDRRLDVLAVFRDLVQDGITPDIRTWNAVLASHVFRRQPLIRADLTAAAKVYEHVLLQRHLAPDATTFSLLMHGGLCFANQDPQVNFGLRTALEAFAQANERHLLVGGRQIAMLMRALARQQKWEEAKAAGEAWWTLSWRRDESGKEVQAEEEEVKAAGRDVVKLEAAAARRRWRRDSAEVGVAEVEGEREVPSFRLAKVGDEPQVYFPPSSRLQAGPLEDTSQQ
ncbi:hypothetical protein RQP46_004523 [Phenoliferia psychrophenolica]